MSNLNRKLTYGLGILITLLLIIYFTSNVAFEQPPMELSGTYTGKTMSSDSVIFTFKPTARGYTGYGNIGNNRFVFSGIATLRVQGMMIDSIGKPISASVELLLNGNEILLSGNDEPITLRRQGTNIVVHSGGLSGHYKSGSITNPIGSIDLIQDGSLISGSGVFFGQPVTLGGIVNKDDTIKGIISFQGEVESMFSANAKGKFLTIQGFGDPIIFQRD